MSPGMRPAVNVRLADAVREFRHLYVTNAAAAVFHAGHPAPVVRSARRLAGLRWRDEYPFLASRMEVRDES